MLDATAEPLRPTAAVSPDDAACRLHLTILANGGRMDRLLSQYLIRRQTGGRLGRLMRAGRGG